jgi:hypothetical protein
MKDVGKLLDPLGIFKSDSPSPSAATAADPILDRQESDVAAERAKLTAEQFARQRAARRGGYRALLSQERMTPETGLQTTLGAG